MTTIRSNHHSWHTWLVLPALSLVACSPPDAPLPALSLGEPIRAVERIRALEFSLEDELGIVFVSDLIPTPSGYALADTGGWVLLLDRDLGLRHRFGGVGSGPKELRLPQDLERLPGNRVAIFDSGNNRITVIDDAGALVSTIPAGEGPLTDFAPVNGGAAFAVGSSGDRSLLRALPGGTPAFGQLPRKVWAAIDGKGSIPALGTHLVADRAGRIHHFDEHSNSVLSYSSAGAFQQLVTLPPEVHERIRRQAAAMEGSFGGRAVLSQTWMLGLGAYDDLIVLSGTPPGVEGLALVLNPETWEAAPIVPAPALPATEFQHVARVLLEGDRITTIKPSGIYQYRIEWPPSLRVDAGTAADPRGEGPGPT